MLYKITTRTVIERGSSMFEISLRLVQNSLGDAYSVGRRKPKQQFPDDAFGLHRDLSCVYVSWVGEVRFGSVKVIARGRISSIPTTNPANKPPKWAERSVVLVMEP